MTATTTSDAQNDAMSSPRLTLGWALKRAVLAVLIIVFGMGAMAWLMHTSTQPAAETSSLSGAPPAPASPLSQAVATK